jgi:small subunit ribosomal protein S6e
LPKSKLIVADPSTGKSSMYELSDEQSRTLKGLKIGNELDGTAIGVEGKIRITGGSDSAGFPMRYDVLGGIKKKVLLTKGIGFRTKNKGIKRRKMVRGNTITEEIYQINSILLANPKEKKEVEDQVTMEKKGKKITTNKDENPKDNQ